MKKILGFISVLLLTLVLVACGRGSAAIDEVKETLPGLFDNPDNVTSGFSLPTEFMHEVTGEWSSSDLDYVTVGRENNGMVQIIVNRPNFADGDKIVELSVELVDGKKKDTWSINLKIIKLAADTIRATTFADAVTADNAGKTIIIPNVALYYPQGGNGYYLSTEDGSIAFVYGQTGMPEAGKLYNLTAQVDNYYNSLQLASVNLVEVDGTANHVVPHKEMTIAEIVAMPLPSEDHVYGHDPITVKDVKIIVEGTGNYNTFLVDKDFDQTKDERTAENSIMFYYPAQINELRALQGIQINQIDLVLEGYRTDRHVWYFSYLKPMDQIDLVDLTDADKVGIDANNLTIETNFPEAGTLELPTTGSFESAIAWSFDDANNANNSLVDLSTGKITIPAEPGRVEVKVKATLTQGDAETTKVFTLYIGSFVVVTVADALALEDGKWGMIKGVVTDRFTNQTYGFQDGTGSIAIYTPTNLVLGQEYTLIGEKDTFNGLHQFKNIEIEGTPNAAVMPTAFAIDAILGDKDELAKHIAGLISIEGAEVTEVGEPNSFGNVNVKIKKGDVVLEVRYDSRVDDKASTTVLTALKVGDIVNYVGNLGWYNNPQLGYGPNTHLGEGWPGAEPVEPVEPIDPEDLVTVTAKYEGTTSGNMVVDANNAEAIALDPAIFNVTSDAIGQYNNVTGLNKDGSIRLYANRADGNGNTLLIKVQGDQKITNIKIVFGEGSNIVEGETSGVLTLGTQTNVLSSSDFVSTTKEYSDLYITEFSLKNTTTGSKSGQIWIETIEITYAK